MADWFYRQNGKIVGPVTRQELDFLVSTGRVNASTDVRSDDMGQWRPLSKQPTSQSPNTTHTQSEVLAAGPSSEMAEIAAPTTLQPKIMASPDAPPQRATSLNGPVRRQAVAGVAGAALLLIGLWLFWNYFNYGGQTDGIGGQGMADMGEGRGARATPGGRSKSGSTPEQNDELMAAAPFATETKAITDTNKGSDNEEMGAATASGIAEKQSQQQVASSVGVSPNESQLPTETVSGQNATVPGDPSSKFTISAPGEATFFGLRASGRRFVFVVDHSGSMAGEPLKRAKEELMKCLSHLPQHVEAHVVFFDDNVLSEPGMYRKLHRRNVESIQKWVDRVSAGGGTNVKAGMKYVFSRHQLPDAIFLLTDGQFDTDTPQLVRQLNPDSTVTINTVALVSNSGEYLLKRIAQENKGDYRFVP
jgi:Mg-chelatase subunit ChlD